MSIKDLIGKVTSRVKGEPKEDFDDFDKEFQEESAAPAVTPPGGGYEAPTTPAPAAQPQAAPAATPAQEPAPTAEPEPEIETLHEDAGAKIGQLQNSLENIKNKLDMLETHLETIDSKAAYQKTEEERLMQYLTMINEKLDHLEQEHSALESLLKPKA